MPALIGGGGCFDDGVVPCEPSDACVAPLTATLDPRAVALCSLDTSEWMRNGDYAPTRLDAQHDAGASVTGWGPAVVEQALALSLHFKTVLGLAS